MLTISCNIIEHNMYCVVTSIHPPFVVDIHLCFQILWPLVVHQLISILAFSFSLCYPYFFISMLFIRTGPCFNDIDRTKCVCGVY